MRLYLNPKEIEPLKTALRNASPKERDVRDHQLAVLERITLCEKLQRNCEVADARK